MATMASAGLLSPLHCHLNELPLLGSSSIRNKLAEFRFCQPNIALKHARNASIVPVVRAQSSSGYVPDSKFYKVEAILRQDSFCLLIIRMLSSEFLPLLSFQFITSMDHEASVGDWDAMPVELSVALLKIGIRGVTVSDVRGFGAQGGSTERHGGSEFSEDNFVAKIKMEIVVSKDQVEAVVDTIIEAAKTGEIGDGKIFVVPVSDVIRVRTGERGEKAEKMTGGLSDVSSA
ncbi:hypothetical protein C1H46_002888 [Malus baccata]|uniref:PII protein n=1 Tax=Malus baccata TaxID=106549 RepID=A0A540NLI3_MALBA|nr:hypothetical protein C1H46_002888 [Malus baccata]